MKIDGTGHTRFQRRRRVVREEDEEGDWIFVGDMNRYGKRSASSTNRSFDQLFVEGWKQSYRFPLLEAITEPDDMKVFRADSDKNSTTVAQSKNLYDQIIITKGAYRELAAESPALGTHVGIIPFDMREPFASVTDHNEVEYRVSDHRPIWARFRIDHEDDD